MADKLVDPLVSFSVKMLLNLLVQEARFLGAVRGEVDDMKRELTRMQCFLIDADKRRGGQGREDVVVSNLVFEIQELAYYAEEVITTFIVKVVGQAVASSAIERPLPVCFDFKSFFRFVKTIPSRYKVGNQIQEINSKISGLTRSLQTYGVQSRPVPTKPRITYATVVEENVVGLQDHVTTMVAYLKDRTHARTISIWGMGGLGKTTFSKEILRHREIKHYFDHVAWVCVSQQCNEHQVWRDILLGFAHQSEYEKKVIRKLTPNELVDRLDSLQKNKKCLVILDDIWKQDDWNSLCRAFPTATNTGSKIVLTTRNKALLSLSSFRSFSYQMPSLKEDECMQLLKNKAFSQEHA